MSDGLVSASRSAMRLRPTKPFAPVMATFMATPPEDDLLHNSSRSNGRRGKRKTPPVVGPGERGDAGDHVEQAEQLPLLQAGDDDRIEPQERRAEPEAAVEHAVQQEHAPLRRVAADPRPVAEQDDEDDDVDEEAVSDDGVDEGRLAARRGGRVAHAPGGRRPRDGLGLAVDDVADKAERLAE